MSSRTWLLLSWIVVGAAVVVVHAVVLRQALNASSIPRRRRLWAFVPIVAPIMAWVDGRRAGPVAWMILVTGYVVLRLLEGAV